MILGTMPYKGLLKKPDKTRLEGKYLKIAKNCHRTVAAGLRVAEIWDSQESQGCLQTTGLPSQDTEPGISGGNPPGLEEQRGCGVTSVETVFTL